MSQTFSNFLEFNEKQFHSKYIRGKIVGPANVTRSISELMNLEIDGVTPDKIFSNEVIWNIDGEAIKVKVYMRYAIIEQKCISPKDKDEYLWIHRETIPIGSDIQDKIEIEDVKKNIIKIIKSKKENWDKKVNLHSLCSNIKKSLSKNLWDVWFFSKKEDIEIKDISDNRKIISVSPKGTGLGPVGQGTHEKIYKFLVDVSVNKHNIIKIIQGNISGNSDGGDWNLVTSDMISHFAPWQKEEEIAGCIGTFANRF